MGLNVSRISKSFGSGTERIAVLESVDFQVKYTECVAVLGPSGCGKTTLISLVAGYLAADQGQVMLDGASITGPAPDRVVVSQSDSLMPFITAFENCRYAGRVARCKERKEQIDLRARELFARFGLVSLENRFPKELSGGQRRRVELIRAFAAGAKAMLLDEPHIGLDPDLKTLLSLYLLRWLAESTDSLILLATHDFEEACFLADRILILGGIPASVVAEERISFSVLRDSALPLTQEFADVVRRVRKRYQEFHRTEEAILQ